jgi:small redox-active disulfide protein 2
MSGIRHIEVLGPGCSRCEQTYKIVRQVVTESGLDIGVSKVTSIDRMVEMGILATPAIIVDGELKLAGQVPKAEFLRNLLGIES